MTDKMKYSFIMPYIDRGGPLYNTLLSFDYHYGKRRDYEVVIVEDLKNSLDDKLHRELLEVVKRFEQIYIVLLTSRRECLNPAPAFNFGVSRSLGKYIILTNPECMHTKDILSEMDAIFNNDEWVYVICGCRESDVIRQGDHYTKLAYVEGQWFVHTKYNNRRLHFCSALHRETYLKVGGFDEEYARGIGYDDDDFRNTMWAAGVKFVDRDDLLIYHQRHSLNYQKSDELRDLNRKYYMRKWQ